MAEEATIHFIRKKPFGSYYFYKGDEWIGRLCRRDMDEAFPETYGKQELWVTLYNEPKAQAIQMMFRHGGVVLYKPIREEFYGLGSIERYALETLKLQRNKLYYIRVRSK